MPISSWPRPQAILGAPRITRRLWCASLPGLVEALSGIGITFRARNPSVCRRKAQEGDVFEPFAFLNFVRFGLRDAQPVDEAKGQVEDFMKARSPSWPRGHREAGDDLYQRGPKRYRKSPFEVLTGDGGGCG